MVDKDKDKDTPQEISTLAELVKDKELLKSIENHPDQACSVIVQANLPKRNFEAIESSSKRPGSKRLVRGDDSATSKKERNQVLEQLLDQLGKLVGNENTSLLKSAGSIVVNGTASQIEEISKLENIEAIWANRELPVKEKPSVKK